jgi:hypothetical protein
MYKSKLKSSIKKRKVTLIGYTAYHPIKKTPLKLYLSWDSPEENILFNSKLFVKAIHSEIRKNKQRIYSNKVKITIEDI